MGFEENTLIFGGLEIAILLYECTSDVCISQNKLGNTQ